jgi:DNA polymerase (family X)
MATFSKALVVRSFQELSLYLQLLGENSFKTRAYDIAAERLSGLAEDIETLIAEDRLVQVPGIGASIAAKVVELKNTGTIEVLEAMRNRFPPSILELLDVPDLGPKKVKALFESLQIGSIAELEKACQAHQVRSLKGFGAKTEEKLLAGIALARRSKASGGRKRLDQARQLAQTILDHLRQSPSVIRSSLGGSVRRQKETVADVDIVASSADPAAVFAHLLTFAGIDSVIAQGESKTSVRLVDSDLQVDVRVLPDEDFAAALHHFTGSKAHHIHLRGLALEKGLTISEWGVFRLKDKSSRPTTVSEPQAKHLLAGEKLPVPDEAALYQLLGMAYVPPELREDWGEIEAAQQGRLPKTLIETHHIAGNVHSHSTWSDGANSLLEMALAARALGFKYLTVTEHSQSSGYANGLNLDRLKAQWDEIDSVNEQVPQVRLLKGIESDILEDGRLDYPDSVLAKLDVVICSIHQRHGQDEAAMTNRVLEAMKSPFFHIWGHPTGRLLLKREPAAMRMEEILDAAAQHGVVIEINGCPERVDLAPEWIRKAKNRQLRFSVSTDAHATSEMPAHLESAVAAARRGWLEPADVINTQPADAFLSSLRKH